MILPPALKRWGPPRRQGLCSHLAHLWATCDSAPRSEAMGTPQAAGSLTPHTLPLWDHKLQDSHAPQQQVHRTFQATQGRVRKTLLVGLNTKQGPSPQNMVHTNSTPHNEVPTVKGMNMYTRTNNPLACSTYVGSKPPRTTSDMGVTPAEAGVGRCQNCFRRMSAGVKNFFGRCWHVLKNISAAAGGCRQVFQQVLRPGMHHIARLTDVSYLSYQTQR